MHIRSSNGAHSSPLVCLLSCSLSLLSISKFPYAYFLWSSHTDSFLPVQRDIEPNRDEMKWSDSDNLLCDQYSADLTEEMKYRRNQ
jgi:hypothetical protein